MAAIDKLYGTQEQYNQLRQWLAVNNKLLLDDLYPEDYTSTSVTRPIAMFSIVADGWLLEFCPFRWVIKQICEQYDYCPFCKEHQRELDSMGHCWYCNRFHTEYKLD